MTKKTEYRTLYTTDKGVIRVGDRVTISRAGNEDMGAITGVAYTNRYGDLLVADFLARSDSNTIHKIERPVNALPTEPGLYTVAPAGAGLEGFRVFTLHTGGTWEEHGDTLAENHLLFKFVADGTWTLRRLVVEEEPK